MIDNIISKNLQRLKSKRRDIRYFLWGIIGLAALINPVYTFGLLFILYFVLDIYDNIYFGILALISVILCMVKQDNIFEPFIMVWFLEPNGWRLLLTTIALFIYNNAHDTLWKSDFDAGITHEKVRLENSIEQGYYPFDNKINTLIVGTTRSGKTTAMCNIIQHALDDNEFICIVSGKNGLKDKYSMYHQVIKMCKTYKRKLYIVSTHLKAKNNIIYNPFKYMTITEIADIMTAISEFTEPHYKEATKIWIMKICEALELLNVTRSIPNIVALYEFNDFIDFLCENMKKGKLTEEQVRYFSKAEGSAKIAIGSKSRFESFITGDAKNIFIGDENKPIKCVRDARNEKAVILFDLDGLKYEDFSPHIGMMITADIRDTVTEEEEETIEEKKLLVFDELSVFFSKLFPRVYSHSAGYGYYSISGTQSFADCDRIDPNFTEELIENSHQFCFLLQNSAKDANRCSEIIGTRITSEITSKISGNEYLSDGTQKFVREYKVHPDDIKELKSRECYVYSKNYDRQELVKMKWDFVNTDKEIENFNYR